MVDAVAFSVSSIITTAGRVCNGFVVCWVVSSVTAVTSETATMTTFTAGTVAAASCTGDTDDSDTGASDGDVVSSGTAFVTVVVVGVWVVVIFLVVDGALVIVLFSVVELLLDIGNLDVAFEITLTTTGRLAMAGEFGCLASSWPNCGKPLNAET